MHVALGARRAIVPTETQRSAAASCSPAVMLSTEQPVVHPEFTDPDTDVKLVSCDGTHFRIASSHLARTAGFFRGMFELPKADGAAPTAHSIAMDEDTLTVEILFKIATGLPPGLERLRSLADVEQVLLAAEKYDMQAALELVGRELRMPGAHRNPLHIYAIANHHRFDDVADQALEKLKTTRIDFALVSSLDGAGLQRILAARESRIQYFRIRMQSTEEDGPFKKWNSDTPTCPCCGLPPLEQGAVLLAWCKFQLAATLAYTDAPSLAAIFTNINVEATLERLDALYCFKGNCRKPLFPWKKFLALLRECELPYSLVLDLEA